MEPSIFFWIQHGWALLEPKMSDGLGDLEHTFLIASWMYTTPLSVFSSELCIDISDFQKNTYMMMTWHHVETCWNSVSTSVLYQKKRSVGRDAFASHVPRGWPTWGSVSHVRRVSQKLWGYMMVTWWLHDGYMGVSHCHILVSFNWSLKLFETGFESNHQIQVNGRFRVPKVAWQIIHLISSNSQLHLITIDDIYRLYSQNIISTILYPLYICIYIYTCVYIQLIYIYIYINKYTN